MKILALLAIVLFSLQAHAQKVYGTVYTTQGDLLPFSSVTIKGTSRGVSATDRGRWSFNLPTGTYTLVCRHIGYTLSEKTVEVKGDTEVTFILADQQLTLATVVVDDKAEDPAYEIIRNAIKKRTFYANQVNAFTCNIYGKDLIRLRNLPKKFFGTKVPDEDVKAMGLDSTRSGIVYLSESLSKASIQEPGKSKLEVISSRVSGSDGFGFNFPPFITLYTNNVKIFTSKFNPRGFVSPIADGAISFYKFKFLGTFYENGKAYSSIRVTPRRKYEPLFSGTINIEDDRWSIHSFDLMLTKTSQLEIMDTLRLTQQHVELGNDIYRVKNQLLHFNFKQFGLNALGNFLTVYSDYDLQPRFDKKFFDRVVIKYDTAVNKRSKEYWDTIRAVPLEQDEIKDYKVKDSSFRSDTAMRNSKAYRDSVNRRMNKIGPFDIIRGGIRQSYLRKNRTVSFGMQELLTNTEYNPAEGVAISFKPYFSNFRYRSRVGYSLSGDIRYGFHNQHLNPSLFVTISSRTTDSLQRIKRFSISFGGGKRVSQYNKESFFPPLKNTIGTLLFGRNYLKTYENYFFTIGHTKRFESGLRVNVNALYEDRISLNNTTHYSIRKENRKKITPNYPIELLSAPQPRHQAVILSASASFKPGQRYIQFPRYKMSIGSKYPTFTLDYWQGIKGIAASDVNFAKWRLSAADDANLKLAGSINYKLGIGGFLNRKRVFVQDYQHFNGNLTRAAAEYVNSFQLASYFANSTTASLYGFGHLEHHFNGLLTNKIPLFRRLNWNIVTGSNAFYVNKKNNYVEVFAGLENIFKIFRVDGVIGYDPSNKVLKGIRIGAGGLLGSSVRVNRSGNEVNLSF